MPSAGVGAPPAKLAECDPVARAEFELTDERQPRRGPRVVERGADPTHCPGGIPAGTGSRGCR